MLEHVRAHTHTELAPTNPDKQTHVRTRHLVAGLWMQERTLQPLVAEALRIELARGWGGPATAVGPLRCKKKKSKRLAHVLQTLFAHTHKPPG